VTYIEPLLTLFFLISAASLWRAWRESKSRPLLLTLGLAGLFLACWPPADWLFSRPLESRYRVERFFSGGPQAIVVLASDVAIATKDLPVDMPDSSTYARCRYAAWLHSRWGGVPVLVTGGVSADGAAPFASQMSHLLQAEGVPVSKIWTEDRSHNTHQNALFSSEILRRNGVAKIALVLEADTMLRAQRCFERQGLHIMPVAFRRRGLSLNVGNMVPSWAALRRNERSFHEYLALTWYWLHGWV
jgi:uncharacterized SAM-binding protein YcdF (DUF218 family)